MQAHIIAYNQIREYEESQREIDMMKAMTPKAVSSPKKKRGK